MPDEDSITSTGRQADFSSGALQTGSTKPWDLNLPETISHTCGADSDLALFLTEHYSSTQISTIGHASNQEKAGETQNPLVLFTRLLCHGLVARIPDQGLPELCESMGNIYEFYWGRLASQPTLLPEEKFQARLGQAYERPGFEIAEE